MDINQIIILAIVVLVAVIVVFGVYFLIVYLKNKKATKKSDTIFNPTNLVEEESLLNVMDRKKNVEFVDEKPEEKKMFLSDDKGVDIVTLEVLKEKENVVNPFGVDMTMRTKDNVEIKPTSETSNNKFIK